MTQRPRRRRGLRAALAPLALACALALAGLGAASAQEEDGPLRLLPETGTGVGAPAEPPSTVIGGQKKPAIEVDESVVVGELDTVGPDSLGLSEVPGGALPRGLWRGSARRFVESLLETLPDGAPSPAMRALAIRLLATPGPPPAGPEGGATPGTFLAARAKALAAMGEYQIAGALLREGAGAGLAEATRRRLESDLLFLAGGDYGQACQQVRVEVQRERDAYWQKALIFCQIVSGEAEAARIGLDLLREGGTDDPAFFTLADALLGGKAELKALPEPTPLHFAMLRQARLAAPEDAISGANPALLRLVAASAESPMQVRIAAVEAAEAAGTVPAESVGRFYMAAEFKKEQRVDPVPAAAPLPGPMARALLFRAATVETEPEARARLLAAGFARARQDGVFPTFARAAFPLVSKLDIQPALAWFAGDAARALLAASETIMAGRWYRLATQQDRSDPDATATALALWPIMTLSGVETTRGFDANRFDDWLEANGGPATPEVSARANLVLTLLQATGANIPASVWRSLALGAMNEQAYVATPAANFVLDDAIENKRIGETGLLGLISIGDPGPSSAATATLGRVVGGLSGVGLDDAARALALEAALGKGL